MWRLGAHPIDNVRLCAGARTAEARLPFRAAGLTRFVLDEELLAHAAELGTEVHRGAAARAVSADGIVSGTYGDVSPAALLLATGKHALRGIPRDAEGAIADMVGIKLHLRLAPAQRAAVANHIELHLFSGGYAGLQLVERDQANLCLAVSRDLLAAQGCRPEAVLESLARTEPQLARRLDGAVPLLDRPLTIAGVPYGFVHRARAGERAFRLGDQAAVIPSFCGDGMGIALHSAKLAADALLMGLAPEAYHRRLARDVGGPVRRATWAQKRVGMSAEGQAGLVRAAAMLPPALRLAARLTRIPASALRRAGLYTNLPGTTG